MRVGCFQCEQPIEVDDDRMRDLSCPSCGAKITLSANETETMDERVEPKKLDKFVLLGLIGRGGFGKVYRAHDPDLDRDVAIKLPNPEQLGAPIDTSRVLVECTRDDTELRVLKALRKACPNWKDAADLVQAVARLRRDLQDGRGGKLLLVLDQFEQWLHAQSGGTRSQLLLALRQADGARVQCLVVTSSSSAASSSNNWSRATSGIRARDIRSSGRTGTKPRSIAAPPRATTACLPAASRAWDSASFATCRSRVSESLNHWDESDPARDSRPLPPRGRRRWFRLGRRRR